MTTEMKHITGLWIVLAGTLLLSGTTCYAHNELRDWAADNNDPAVVDYSGGGLTSYLRALSKEIEDHIEQPAEAAHNHPDSHQDPPPPPKW